MQDDCITIALELPGVRVLSQEETEERITVEVRYRASGAACPRCGRWAAKVHSVRPQSKRDRRLWDKRVCLVLHKRRFRCVSCGKVFTEPDPVCGARRRSSRRFRAHLGQEAMHQTVRHVACKEGVGEGLVRRCLTEEARRRGEVPEQPPSARILGLDEFSVRRGQVYDTAIMDIEYKHILGVVSGHRQQEVQAFLERLPAPEQVAVVVMDRHEPFRQAVEFALPKAKIVADKFHVLVHVHQALERVRTSLPPIKGNKGELFRSRYLLLTGVERLTAERRTRLMDMLGRYPVLQRAWALKEAFRAWYQTATRAEAEQGLSAWEADVRKQGPAPFRKLLPMLRDWRQEVLNYFDYPYPNGFVEGKNNRIRVVKRVAYGYRNNGNFRQMILLTNPRDTHLKAA